MHRSAVRIGPVRFHAGRGAGSPNLTLVITHAGIAGGVHRAFSRIFLFVCLSTL